MSTNSKSLDHFPFVQVKTDIFDEITLFFKIALEVYTISTARINENATGLSGNLNELYTDIETNLEKEVEASLGFDCVFKRKCLSGVDFWLRNFL